MIINIVNLYKSDWCVQYLIWRQHQQLRKQNEWIEMETFKITINN